MDGRPSGTLGDVLTEHRRRRFVGRSAEIELFRAALDGAIDPPYSLLHVHGPGGVGKTSLLEVLGAIAAGAGATVARIDGRDLDPSPVSVLEALEETLSIPAGDGPVGLPEGGGRLVLLVDAYEQLTPLDQWFRARLIPRLPASAITVIAGRDAPTRAWRTDPAWGALLRVVSLRNLSPEDSHGFLRKAGLDRHLHERIVRLTYGHPLGLALLTDVVARGGRVESDVLPLDLVEVLLPRFVETVPDSRHRRVLGACAVARCTTEALLRDVLVEGDVRDVFTWLRELSFIEPRPDGLAPHDLARDVLDADLRWRDFDGYQHVFRKVREHSLAALRKTTGRAQQRAIFDLKFLFRQVRTAMSPVEWGSWGAHYPERARPADGGPILELVQAWEGRHSAAIAARWLDRQPEGFFVIRDHEGEVLGMLAILDLARSSRDDVDADPGARAAWDFAHSSAPPRPGEALTLCRFVIDRHRYQGPSPTLNATPILTLQKQLSTPNLSWDFLALAEPDKWDAYFAMGDLPRAEGADFSVGDRRYGLFAHDFRKVPVDAWTELWTERALTQDVDVAPRDHAQALLVLSHPDFEAAVRQGFKDLRRPDLLARNPLLRTRLVADRTGEGASGAAVLEAVLREAATTLAHHPRDDKLLRAVDRTYLRPAATQEAAAAALGLPFSTYRRHLTQGMTRIVSVLWDQEVYGQDRAEVNTS
ncbi:ATP-binding protein [Kribbella sp. VKM Ac-2568]|uniref:ATP-binding protein n=1 Tax=Kribbella sp. VKM Ac-2568 TaxID=2512219 RepID=UPI001043618A|nr:ATP-binding protein [Kribbella sp. VKM Ac-2568]